MRAMARDPDKRFQTVPTFVDAVEAWASARGVSVDAPLAPARASRGDAPRPSAVDPSELPRLPPTVALDGEVDALQFQVTRTDDSWAQAREPTSPGKPGRGRIIVGMSAAAVVLALGVVVFAATRGSGRDEATRSAKAPATDRATPVADGVHPDPAPSDVAAGGTTTAGKQTTAAADTPTPGRDDADAAAPKPLAAGHGSAPRRPRPPPPPVATPHSGGTAKPATTVMDFGY
jgi:hypothetical protein